MKERIIIQEAIEEERERVKEAERRAAEAEKRSQNWRRN